MQILAQSRDVMVNMNHIHALTVINVSGVEEKEEFRILAWEGNEIDEFYGLGDYTTKARCKEIIKEIWTVYGQYYHREGGPAILKGTIDIPELFFVPPKVYEMPEV